MSETPPHPAQCPYPAAPPPVSLSLTVTPEHPCPYLPDRQATSRAFWAPVLAPELYHAFMDAAFRRSGRIVYQPICRGCRACLPIRVPVATFSPTKSQRRCRRRNEDLSVTTGQPAPTDEKHDLYRRYLNGRHTGAMTDDRESYEDFLYNSPVHTIECCYRDPAGRLLAVGLCDLCPQSLSSVYFYYDPAESRRGLGTFGVLHEIDLARQLGVPHYYLGYWIPGCGTMDYKATFRPNEVLHPDGHWRPNPPPIDPC